MSSSVYANGMAISCKAGAGKSICSFPDVCFTPPQTPATPMGVPLPYPNTGVSSDTADGSSTVKVGGEETMLKNASHYKKSVGDEAGAAPKKGLINSKIGGKVFFAAWSMDVKIEGQNVTRHLDLTTHNHGSGANAPVTWPNVESMDVEGPLKKKPCKGCKKNTKKAKDDAYENMREKTPSQAARDKLNARNGGARKKCITCPRTPKRISADHVVPLSEICDMPGFACLSEEDQKKVADHDGNMAGLCRSCNSSKQDKLWNEWKNHKKRDFPIPKRTRDKGSRVANASRRRLKRLIRSKPCEK